jgi:glycosyltransferase involved in cell wall biosynthesis
LQQVIAGWVQRRDRGGAVKVLSLSTVASTQRYLLLAQLTALIERGHEVLAVSADGDDVEHLVRRGVRHRALPGSTRGFDLRADLRAAWALASIIRDERPDVVHTHNPKPGIYGRIIARSLGVPMVVNTVHGLYATPGDRWQRRAAVYGLEALASRFSHLELVQSIEDVELMVGSPLAPSAKVRFLGNGIDTERFTPPTAQQRSEVRAELGIDADDVVIVSVGRLVVEKGFRELLAASGAMTRPHTLMIVGPDDPEKADALTPDVVQRARGRGVRFLGHRTDLDRLLPAADVFALASYREGVPRAAMEGASSGLPVVATDVRGCRQVVDHQRTGLLVPVRSVQPLADALDSLVADGETRARLGRAARAKAEAEFDERDVLLRLFDGYHEVGLTDEVDLTVGHRTPKVVQ